MARIGSTAIAKAFINGNTLTIKSTSTDGTEVRLHGNRIAWIEDSQVRFSMCGWNTVTTRDRLNHIFDALNVPLRACQRKHEPYIYNYKTDQLHEISSWLPYATTDFI